jgi:hypothetical protein
MKQRIILTQYPFSALYLNPTIKYLFTIYNLSEKFTEIGLLFNINMRKELYLYS